MNGRPRFLTCILLLFWLGNACFVTDELGLAPANSVREDEVGKRVMRQAATGWFAGAHAYTVARQLGKITSYDHFMAAYSLPFSARPATYASETVYYTGPSVKLCEFSARSYAYSVAFMTLEYADIQQTISDMRTATTTARRTELSNQLDFAMLLSSYFAINAADAGCRSDLVRTGSLFELDRGRL